MRTATAALCAVGVLGACGSSAKTADPAASTTTTAVPATTTTLPLPELKAALRAFYGGEGKPLLEFLRVIEPISQGTAIAQPQCDEFATKLGQFGTAKQLVELSTKTPDGLLARNIGNLAFIVELSLATCRVDKKPIPASAVTMQQQQWDETAARLQELGIAF